MAKRIPDEEAYIAHGDLKIPVSIYFERRRNTRISIGANVIHLRLPKNLDKKDFDDQLHWAQKWLHKRFDKAPNLLERFKTIQFHHGDRIQVLGDVYVLHLEEDRRKSSNASLANQDIFISLAIGLEGKSRHKVVQTLIHKLLCKRYADFMYHRVKVLNDTYFRQPFARVELKYIHSKWGSCSHDGNIVLSSKLLLCPTWARDYVIVHELAHLVELNHSPAFWKLVEEVIPDYQTAEKWLDNEGTALEIKPIRSSKLHGILSNASVVPQSDALSFDKTKTAKPEADESFPQQNEELEINTKITQLEADEKIEPALPDVSQTELVLFPSDTLPDAPIATKKKRKPKKKKPTPSNPSSNQLELF